MSFNPYDNIPLDEEDNQSLPRVAPDPIPGDRGEPTTKSPKRRKKGSVVIAIAILVFSLVAAGFFGLFMYRALGKSKSEALAEVKDDLSLATNSSQGPDLGAFQDKMAKQMALDGEAEARKQRARELALAGQSQSAPAGTTPQPGAVTTSYQQPESPQPTLGNYGRDGSGTRETKNGKPVLTPEEEAALRRLDDDVLWTGNSSGGSGSTRNSSAGSSTPGRQSSTRGGSKSLDEQIAANPYLASALGGSGSSPSKSVLRGGSGNNSVNGLLATEDYEEGSAVIRPDLKFLLIHGTTIPCTLIPRIVTNYPGQTACLINRDVYSSDGSVVLIERGSKVEGERKVSLQAGVAKVFVAWGIIETPDGVRVRIDSLAADQLGGAGLDAWVDRHLMERFGGAIALSFLDDVFQAIADKASNNSEDGMSFDNSTDNAQDMSSIALENSINIPPTGYVKHASETNIIIARDISFRSVYGVK